MRHPVVQNPHPLTERRWCYRCAARTRGTWTFERSRWTLRCDLCREDAHVGHAMIGDRT